ncbi:MAG: hypothetical protein LBU32_12010 [Clostridiales bacterium]|nr:hypothetical protein [Clostridiales bacterium]
MATIEERTLPLKPIKVVKILLAASVLLIFLSSCNKRLEGKYVGETIFGIKVSLEFTSEDVTSNILGIPMTGTYAIEGDELTISFTVLGETTNIKGQLMKNKVLIEGVSFVKQKNPS